MAEREVEVLRRARENFVRKRREMAEQMVSRGRRALRAELRRLAIEAIERAIKYETALPADYASSATEQEEVSGAATGSSNVVDVDFDSA